MSLTDALEALRGLPYQQILDTLRAQTTKKVGRIQGKKLKDLQAFIGATGLRLRLGNASPDQAESAAAIAEAIQPSYLAAEDTYSINLADARVKHLLGLAVLKGLLTTDESKTLDSFATYDAPDWPDITMRDVVAHFEPALLDVGDWILLQDVTKNRLMLRLETDLPEPAAVRVEMQESNNGADWTSWVRVTHFMAVQAAGVYYQTIPNNGLHRRIRVRGEQYRIAGTVEAV